MNQLLNKYAKYKASYKGKFVTCLAIFKVCIFSIEYLVF